MIVLEDVVPDNGLQMDPLQTGCLNYFAALAASRSL